MQESGSGAGIGLRKLVVYREVVVTEAGAQPARPAQQASVAAVVRNPWVGTGPTHDLSDEAARIAPVLARLLTDRLIAALGGVDAVEAFGKAAIVGSAGEIEHGGALIHTPYFGNLMREFLDGESIICFADTRAEAGEPLVVPLWHKSHAATRSHYQTVTTRVPDAPRADEIVIVAAASTGPRPHPRIGDRTTDPAITTEEFGECSVMKLRKIVTIVEEIRTEGGREVSPPARVAVVAAVIENPWAGEGFVEDLAPGIDATASDVGALLAPLVLEALEAPAEAYGKAAIVGLDGEVEHGSGLIHTLKFGDHFRKAANATTLLPAVEKRGPAGVLFDIPLKHITDATIRSHHQTVEVRIADAPHPDEIVVALAAAAQGRPQQRLAPLSTEQ